MVSCYTTKFQRKERKAEKASRKSWNFSWVSRESCGKEVRRKKSQLGTEKAKAPAEEWTGQVQRVGAGQPALTCLTSGGKVVFLLSYVLSFYTRISGI